MSTDHSTATATREPINETSDRGHHMNQRDRTDQAIDHATIALDTAIMGLDRRFGEGYAKANPEALAGMLYLLGRLLTDQDHTAKTLDRLCTLLDKRLRAVTAGLMGAGIPD